MQQVFGYIFGYGSLCYPDGINGRGLIHQYKWEDLKPSYLDGYKRGWYAVYKDRYLFYGIIPFPSQYLNGVLIPIHTKYDLMALNQSELEGEMYDLQYVSNKIRNPPKKDVWTYVVPQKSSSKKK